MGKLPTIDDVMKKLKEIDSHSISTGEKSECPICGMSGEGFRKNDVEGYVPLVHPKVAGWTQDEEGFSIVYECPYCHSLFTYGNVKYNFVNFDTLKNAVFWEYIRENY